VSVPGDLALHLKFVGTTLMGLACLHVGFPRRFDWARELARLSLLNRRMMQVHTLFIALIVLMMGALCAAGTSALLERSALGRYVAAGLLGFWAIRLGCQLFVYDSALWRGKRFETAVHVVFVLFEAYLVAVFAALSWHQSCPP
jgi:hypothetical protein